MNVPINFGYRYSLIVRDHVIKLKYRFGNRAVFAIEAAVQERPNSRRTWPRMLMHWL